MRNVSLTTGAKRDVWVIARELAEAIEASPELEAFRKTEDAVLADDAALALIKEYEARKRAVKLSRGKPAEEQQRLVEAFLAVEERLNKNLVIQAYWQARVRLDQFLERINAVVTFPITGSEAPPRKGGCGGGCSCG